MKSLIKLIFFAAVAALTFKYLNDKNINVSEKISEGYEWITSKASEFEKTASDDQIPAGETEKDNSSSYDKWTTEISQSEGDHNQENTVDNNFTGSHNYEQTTEQTGNDNSGYPDTEAEEFPVIEKQNKGTTKFSELDEYARNAPESEESSLTSLAAWLSKPASNDLEKARMIFSWIATHVSYDDNGFNIGNYSDTSPDGVLRNRVSVCQGYSDLFTALGKLAGLEIVTITGYSKGITYRPGKVFGDTDHAWNAVKIEGQWKLFDVTWGAGYGKGVNGKLVSVMQFDEYWFNTQPEEFIFSHLPLEDKWQFNEPIISKYQYERLPYVPGVFFKMGFNGKQCFPSAMDGIFNDLPTAYSIPGEIKIVSLPYNKMISQGKIIRIIIKSDNAVKIAFRNSGSITDMTKEGNKFTAIIHTVPGSLSLMANFGDGASYHTFLEYEVK